MMMRRPRSQQRPKTPRKSSISKVRVGDEAAADRRDAHFPRIPGPGASGGMGRVARGKRE